MCVCVCVSTDLHTSSEYDHIIPLADLPHRNHTRNIITHTCIHVHVHTCTWKFHGGARQASDPWTAVSTQNTHYLPGNMYMYMHISGCMYMYMCIYMYIYLQRMVGIYGDWVQSHATPSSCILFSFF